MPKTREYIVRRIEKRAPRINGVLYPQTIYHEIGRVSADSRDSADEIAAGQFPGEALSLIRVDESKQEHHSV